MRTTVILTLAALIAWNAADARAGEESADQVQRHVVKVITSDGENIENAEDFVFVGDEGKAVHISAHHLLRGGFLGVQLVDLTPELRAHFGVPEDSGVMVSGLSSDGPAAAAGIKVGDIIGAVDAAPVASGGELAALIRSGEEGDVVEIELWRDGRKTTVEATLAERDRPQVDIGQFLWQSGDEEGAKAFQIHMDSLPEEIIRIDEERIQKALEDLDKRLESPEFKARMKSMMEERQLMEERVKELEERLRELEERLSQLSK
jgi:polyhydroxyalkanoate synthesis regulator phasin